VNLGGKPEAALLPQRACASASEASRTLPRISLSSFPLWRALDSW
jgi:hypothetical protein